MTTQNIPFEKGIIFGPVRSRRLGRSLGINLLPSGTKCCTFDCVYCFFGSTPEVTSDTVSQRLPAFDEVTRAIDGVLSDISVGRLEVDFITFAGNGEPTLHPAYPAVVDHLLKGLHKLTREIGTAIFTNGSRLGNAEVRRATALLDQAIVKIDIVDKERFRQINRPRAKVEIEEIARNAAGLPNLRIQTAVMKINGNMIDAAALGYYCHLLKLASPLEVQLYNIIYPPAEARIETVTVDELALVADKVRSKTGFNVVIYNEVEGSPDEA